MKVFLYTINIHSFQIDKAYLRNHRNHSRKRVGSFHIHCATDRLICISEN